MVSFFLLFCLFFLKKETQKVRSRWFRQREKKLDVTSATMAEAMCAFCYKKDSPEKLKRCGRCLARLYCSPECQKLDWGKSGQWHQTFCALSGEEGDSWEVRYISDAVGFGVFATKTLRRR